MQITFLGTSCMMPTKERNPSAVHLDFKSDGLLFDCAEGTQRQIKIAGINMAKINKICLSHWHGDHVLGLAGLLLTIGSLDLKRTINIYGPKGSKESFKKMFGGIEFEKKFNIKITEVHDGTFFENDDYKLESKPMTHPVPCVAYSFIEKDRLRVNMSKLKKVGIPEGPHLRELTNGKDLTYKGKKVLVKDVTTHVPGRKVTIITDTTLNKNCYEIAKDADILICDSTYTSKLKSKAAEHSHLTSLDAAQIASKAGVKKLYLTHFSARYKNTHELEEDARVAFDKVYAAKDFLKIKL